MIISKLIQTEEVAKDLKEVLHVKDAKPMLQAENPSYEHALCEHTKFFVSTREQTARADVITLYLDKSSPLRLA